MNAICVHANPQTLLYLLMLLLPRKWDMFSMGSHSFRWCRFNIYSCCRLIHNYSLISGF
ncbi:hypothetical protein V6Z12_D10G055300 [Gossypium hirsutum]